MVLNCLGWLKGVLLLTDSRINKLKIIDEGNATILQQFWKGKGAILSTGTCDSM